MELLNFFTKSKEEALQEMMASVNKNTEQYKDIIRELILCLYDIQDKGVLESYQLALLEEGMKQSWDYIFFHCSGKFVAKLSHFFKEAEDLLIKLSQDKSSKVRCNSIIILTANPTQKVTNCVITNCISDKSKNVRLTVSNVIEIIGGDENLNKLKEAIVNEKDDLVKIELSKNISLIENGYYLQKDKAGNTLIIMRTNDGLRFEYAKDEDVKKTLNKNMKVIKIG